ncbi:unnamed protein product [Hydatigera taeniaeformis]|uniref:Ovule protein n=1 Tax=Hydatigena taeniaeformis TaxID=6205 RepID=A0A0R3WRI7_HYDTA|nr:unnamed protein product [Hydatigera taeniaeformis]
MVMSRHFFHIKLYLQSRIFSNQTRLIIDGSQLLMRINPFLKSHFCYYMELYLNTKTHLVFFKIKTTTNSAIL